MVGVEDIGMLCLFEASIQKKWITLQCKIRIYPTTIFLVACGEITKFPVELDSTSMYSQCLASCASSYIDIGVTKLSVELGGTLIYAQ